MSIEVDIFIGVPWKGRNFRKAAREALEDTFYDPEFLAERFNGRSKAEAKSEEISSEFLQEVSRPGWSEVGRFVDTGRKSPRFGFDQVNTKQGLVEGYREDPFDSGYDEVFVPDDLGLEASIQEPIELEEYAEDSSSQVYLGENASDSVNIELGEVLQDYVEDYCPEDPVDDGVSLAAMASEELTDQEIETVLVSRDLENISKSIADYIWEDIEIETFQNYSDKKGLTSYDEEQLIGDSPEVAGVYIVGSGDTAEENDLVYDRVADTYLRKWEISPDNSFKELEKNNILEA